jgi:hypothetical protein
MDQSGVSVEKQVQGTISCLLILSCIMKLPGLGDEDGVDEAPVGTK